MILTDIHCHILPGVDDGAKNTKITAEMLRLNYKHGIRRIIVTPHYRRGMFEPPQELVQKQFLRTKKYAAGIGAQGVELYLGCECHRHADMVNMLNEKKLPTMAGSSFVLTEFSSVDPYSRIRTVLYELRAAGYTPIIAHAERYPVMMEYPDNLEDAIALGAMIQINADSLLGHHGYGTKRKCKKMMKRGQVDFIGSDAHDLKKRPSRLAECAAYVEKKWGRETAERIFETNPMQIMKGTLEE